MQVIDVDANATRPASEEALRAYFDGERLTQSQDIAQLILRSRERIAHALGASPTEVVFTRGGSHANVMALWAGVWAFSPADAHLGLSRAEHRASVDAAREIESAQRALIAWLTVDALGCLDAREISKHQNGRPLSMVSTLLAHNETGVVQPIEALARACEAQGALLHLDAVQALGRLPLDFAQSPATMMSLAGHKMGSVGGIGALLVRRETPVHQKLVKCPSGPFFGGFAHTEGARGASAGLCASFAAAVSDLHAHTARESELAALRDAFERHIKSALGALDVSVTIIGEQANRLPNTSLVRVHHMQSEALLMALDVQGFSASSGSACKAGAPEPSASLLAMGFSESAAREVIRVSLSRPAGKSVQEVEEDLQRMAAALEHIAKEMRSH